MDATINLIRHLASHHPIDTNALHATGQSGGGMLTIAMNIKHPTFFASSYLVACQWPAALITKDLNHVKWWITVSADDTKAFPGQVAIINKLEDLGIKVARAEWDAQWTQTQFDVAYQELTAQKRSVNFVVYKSGSVFSKHHPNTGGASEHTATWQYAYNMDAVRAWILTQKHTQST